MIKALDSFRFYAFLAVFLFHVRELPCGYLGVQAFFVLSGFLLTPILVDMKAVLPRSRYFIVFYGRRILRIFPLYYAYLFVAGAVILLAVHCFGCTHLEPFIRFRTQLPYAATYVLDVYQAVARFRPTPLLSHFWSLAVEEQFYLLWPLFIWVVPRVRLGRYLLLVVLAGPIVRGMVYTVVRLGLFHIAQDDALLATYVLPVSHFDAFAVGGLFALRKRTRWAAPLWALICITFAAGLGLQFIEGDLRWRAFGYPAFMAGHLRVVWGYSLMNLTFACMLCALRTSSFLPALFTFGPIQYLGKISYGLYVYHYPAIWLIERVNNDFLPDWLRYVLSLGATVVVSTLSYELFEKKFLALKDKWFRVSVSERERSVLLASGSVGSRSMDGPVGA